MTPEDIIERVAEAAASAACVQDRRSAWILFRLWLVLSMPFPPRVKDRFASRLVREATDLVRKQSGSTSSVATLHATMAVRWMLDWAATGFGATEEEIILYHCNACAAAVRRPTTPDYRVN